MHTGNSGDKDVEGRKDEQGKKNEKKVELADRDESKKPSTRSRSAVAPETPTRVKKTSKASVGKVSVSSVMEISSPPSSHLRSKSKGEGRVVEEAIPLLPTIREEVNCSTAHLPTGQANVPVSHLADLHCA